MIKKILIGFGILLVIVVILGVLAFSYFKPNKEVVLTFIKENPKKSSIYLMRNDSLLSSLNINQKMPLASTVKIIIAIEYAEQAAQKILDPNELIALNELEKYYVPNTDGGAHPSWKSNIKKMDLINDGQVELREVAKGMIKYSSNANTEYLIDRLGQQNINQRLDSLKINVHDSIYYIVSALFVGKERFPSLKGEELKTKLKGLSLEEYIQICSVIHDKLKNDSEGNYKGDLEDLSLSIQRVWSDNLPGSTTKEYAGLMKKINSRNFLSAKTHIYLDEVMEFILENPANRSWLEHSGMKGGSTAFVLTKALYATDKKGNQTELAYFINDLSYLQNIRLQTSMNAFELSILTDGVFRKKIEEQLSSSQ
ncbi:serine hydrolase [Fulvivirgaceae bacterium BMA10]|uniref:beta-lactamase n=1 Tax=Splendidivirga corallicola TaxID=3051826 RepID=A0ABT8KWI3_9BACT|nr:serine hydrolase [Fulvivirgaceae bacterium BMA10]